MKRFIVLFAALAACSSPPLAEAGGDVLVQPERLDFGPTWIGHPAELAIAFENTGRPLVRIELVVAAPFIADPAVVELEGGVRRTVRVRFDPFAEQEYEATLHLSDGRQVPVSGSGRMPPECPPSNLCRTVHFDPASGTCAEERAEEGASCGDVCFGGTCTGGECVGSQVDCNDGNVCTADACDPASGCVHYDDSASCPDIDDPCSAPICDPATGCGFADAPDGTVCGVGDCTTSYVCLQGRCDVVTTPEGGACGGSSPCQDPGVCVAGDCIQDPPYPLEPSWSQQAAPGTTLVFDGVTDGAGQIYWAECSYEACDLVSVTSRGLERYRNQLFAEDAERAPTGSLALAGDLLISTLAPGRIGAWNSSTGQQIWSRSLLPEVEAASDAPRQFIGASHVWVDEAAPPVIAGELILLAVEGFQSAGDEVIPWGGWVVALARATGKVQWIWSEAGTFEGFIGDEGGSVFFSLRPHDAASTDGGLLVSLGKTGVERWRRETSFQAPLATLGGVLIQASGDMRTTADGLVHASLRLLVPTYPRRTPLIGNRSLYAVGVPLEPCGSDYCPTWVPHLFLYDSESGGENWRKQLATGRISEPVLTSDGTIIYAGPAEGLPWLNEVAVDRSVVFACQLPSGGRYDGAASLQVGQWISADTGTGTVMAFGVEKRTSAAAGWVTGGGTPERTARPR